MIYVVCFASVFITLSIILYSGGTWLLTKSLLVQRFSLELRFVGDYTSLKGGILVSFVSTAVFLFATSYLQEPKFLRLLRAFVISILCLIFGNSLPVLLVGWDGLGLTSFFLILYFDSVSNRRSGIVTFMINRLGDGLLIGFVLANISGGDLNLLIIRFAGVWLCAAITKRAQWPFRSWLPLAIDAPTPVSALVHRRTLVTAGFFLVSRVLPEGLYPHVAWFGLVTACFGAAASFLALDFKKVIAYSTLRNLGLLALAWGLGSRDIIFFHLYAHALYKAALFILAGGVLVSNFGQQDLRSQVDSLNLSPLAKTLLVGNILARCGVIFLRTFFSKHALVASAWLAFSHPVQFPILALTLLLTCAYSLRIARVVLLSSRTQSICRATPAAVIRAVVLLSSGTLILGNAYELPSALQCGPGPWVAPFLISGALLRCLPTSGVSSTFTLSAFYTELLFDISHLNLTMNQRLESGWFALTQPRHVLPHSVNLNSIAGLTLCLLYYLV